MPEEPKGRKRDREGYVQLNITVREDLRDRIEDYYHANHRKFESLSDAAGDLLDAGLRVRKD